MNIRTILTVRNRELIADVSLLRDALASAIVPEELRPFRERVLQLCAQLSRQVERKQSYLALGRDEILVDVLSNTQGVVRWYAVINALFAGPILRAMVSDRLSLILLTWLHQAHPRTARFPPVVADGHCSVRPFLDLTPIYYLPAIEQRGLLYLPLLFHEFGHVLYAVHKLEMDSLVGDLQRQIARLLVPLSQRNDPHAQQQATTRQLVAYTWYNWAQEFFCDAVGLVVSGPAFLHAFSGFLLGGLNRGDFYRSPSDLAASSHPVGRLRVRFLIDRARALGLRVAADAVESQWQSAARELSPSEDYHGFYVDALADPIVETIEDMLVEADPRRFHNDEIAGDTWNPKSDSLIRLLNCAWLVRQATDNEFAAWQALHMARVVASWPTA